MKVVTIANANIQIVEYNQERVMTTDQLAQVYECEPTHIKQNFNNNKDRFEEGKHYFKVEGEALKDLRVENFDLQISPKTRILYLWTRRGASRHCKMLGTDKAWEMFDALEENYFNKKGQLKITSMREQAMNLNARTRAGKLLRDLAAMTDMPSYKEILLAKAANITTGEETLPMPKVDSRKTYTAEQLCPMIKRPKTWRSQLGKVLKQNGMEQVADNGYFTRDEVNGHECKTFNWYADIILPKLAELFPNEYAATV